MAKVTIRRCYPDGDEVEVVIRAESTYPDALDQARITARDAFKDAIGAVESTFKYEED